MSLLMEGETKKRKITNIIYENEDDEDIKMEKFFALIRSAKDIRDQLLDAEGPSKARPKKAVATEKKAEAVRVLQKNKEKSFAAAAADAAIVSNRAAVVSTRADVIINNQAAEGSSDAAAAARSSRSSAEEMSNKTADQKNNFKREQVQPSPAPSILEDCGFDFRSDWRIK